MQSLQLNQSNLQDFLECPRRFQLKVIEKTVWPAAIAEPLSKAEQSILLGNQFHRICQQYFSGLDPEIISDHIFDPALRTMWKNFLPFGKQLIGKSYRVENILSMPFLNHKLIAKFDLILQINNQVHKIYDWKTSSKKPSRTDISQRVQTLLYPFIFTESGHKLFQLDIIPAEDVSMHYWYPLCTDPEEVFPYSNLEHKRIFAFLSDTINKINLLIETDELFPLTEDSNKCQRCVFRAICQRGSRGIPLDSLTEIDQEDLSNTHFDLNQIIEIDF